LHTCNISSTTAVVDLVLSADSTVVLSRNDNHRMKVSPNHSMTHALNYFLRKVFLLSFVAYLTLIFEKILGREVEQKGSLVNADRLRLMV